MKQQLMCLLWHASGTHLSLQPLDTVPSSSVGPRAVMLNFPLKQFLNLPSRIRDHKGRKTFTPRFIPLFFKWSFTNCIKILPAVDFPAHTGYSYRNRNLEDGHLSYHCCCSVANSRPPLCNLMNYSTPGFPVLHYLPEFSQIHGPWVADATQSSHHLSPLLLPSILPSIRVFPMSHLFVLGGQSIRASDSELVLPKNIQSWFPLQLIGLISLLSKRLSRVFSSITVQKN